uniref:LSM14 domain-containing protein n=1 Tax=Mesocestoides corti TaxID=53468 RepID=A0A5K3F8I2_MESCO
MLVFSTSLLPPLTHPMKTPTISSVHKIKDPKSHDQERIESSTPAVGRPPLFAPPTPEATGGGVSLRGHTRSHPRPQVPPPNTQLRSRSTSASKISFNCSFLY